MGSFAPPFPHWPTIFSDTTGSHKILFFIVMFGFTCITPFASPFSTPLFSFPILSSLAPPIYTDNIWAYIIWTLVGAMRCLHRQVANLWSPSLPFLSWDQWPVSIQVMGTLCCGTLKKVSMTSLTNGALFYSLLKATGIGSSGMIQFTSGACWHAYSIVNL